MAPGFVIKCGVTKKQKKRKEKKKRLKDLPRKNSILMESVKRMSEDRQPVISDTTKDGSLSVNFSTPKVRIMPSFKQNLAELKGYGRTAPKENKAKIEEIIDLYERKKIPNFRTAENAVIRLNQTRRGARGRSSNTRRWSPSIGTPSPSRGDLTEN